MRAATLTIVWLLIVLLLGAGCNKAAKTGDQAGQTQPGASQQQASQEATAQQDGAGATSGAAEPESQSAQAQAEPEVKEHQPEPADPVIGGTWFALFGRHENNVVESAWENGHRVRFLQNGVALWVKIENGWEISAMDAKYKVAGNKIRVSFSARRCVDLGISSLAPLGIGRDEEIGLLAKTPGRDTEIGLESGTAGKQAADAERVENLDFSVDGNYLVISDSRQNTTVYAKVLDQVSDSAPAVGANWQGNIAGAGGAAASASLSGSALTLNTNSGQGQFSGKYVHGFFAGKFKQGSQLSLAALELQPDGSLNGLLLPDPYTAVEVEFDFEPAPPPTT